MNKYYIYFLVFAVIVISAIFAGIHVSAANQNLMQQKCTKCHALKVPDNYTKEEWKKNVERMAPKAGLNAKEIQSIIDLNTKK